MVLPASQWINRSNGFLTPSGLFVLIGLVFGLIHVFCVPPFQVADEDRHFFRALQTAEGRFVSEVHDGQAGGWMPVGAATFAAGTEAMRWDLQKKTTFREIAAQARQPLDPDHRVFVPFRSAVYSPAAYLPAAAAMRPALFFEVSPLMLMYIGRLANLLTWLVLTWAALRLVPFYKWLFFVLALTPMSLYQAASLSADSLTNALAFLCLALFLAEAFNVEPFRRRSLGRLLAVTVLLTLTKNIFLLFGVLFFLIPVRRFARPRQYALYFSILLVTNAAALAAWAGITRQLPIFWAPDVFPQAQAAYICRHPVEFLQILAGTVKYYFWSYYSGFVGAFGWQFVYPAEWHVRLWLLLVALVSITDADREKPLSWPRKTVMGAVFAAVSILVFTLLYACWNPVGAPLIEGVQSRYFIPVVPLLCMLFSNRTLSTNRFHWKLVLIPPATVVSLIAALVTIVERFYEAA
jgi:uncharacterized membrane protein